MNSNFLPVTNIEDPGVETTVEEIVVTGKLIQKTTTHRSDTLPTIGDQVFAVFNGSFFEPFTPADPAAFNVTFLDAQFGDSESHSVSEVVVVGNLTGARLAQALNQAAAIHLAVASTMAELETHTSNEIVHERYNNSTTVRDLENKLSSFKIQITGDAASPNTAGQVQGGVSTLSSDALASGYFTPGSDAANVAAYIVLHEFSHTIGAGLTIANGDQAAYHIAHPDDPNFTHYYDRDANGLFTNPFASDQEVQTDLVAVDFASLIGVDYSAAYWRYPH